MIRKASLFLLVSAVGIILGCKAKNELPPPLDYYRPLPPGESALRKITDPAEIPDFTPGCFDLYGLQRGIANSLNFLSKPSSERFFPCGEITHDHAVASLEVFDELLASNLTQEQLNTAIREKFDVYISVGCDDQGTVLFTGYYTPIFNGSPERTSRFRYPLYRQPEDLMKTVDGEILGRRRPDGSIAQYPPRQEIESSGMLNESELVWMEDPFEVYVAHVQGSARLRMPNGRLITIGYAANNGHEYRSIQLELISDGQIPADRMSLSAMIEFFKTHPSLVAEYTRRNPRFVFFTETEGDPRGSINEPVITLRTIATDKTIFPPAGVTYIDTKLPRVIVKDQIGIMPYRGFALDQDTGGAIRAPGRCDVYMGTGDQAGMLAGQTYQEGRMYYLFQKQ
ncbi:MAG: hypothetical protein AMJ79_07615 [Phycisphaerae bacterium SM23_30]|nr:MAG: hypothetical protein AMJ79_07615 [Phycisphaerae bacterium SM23_30]